MNRLIFILLAIIVLSCSQKTSEPIFYGDDDNLVEALTNQVGVPITGNFYQACDTITNEVIWVDIINSSTCNCLTQNGAEFVERSCDNVAPCEDEVVSINCTKWSSIVIGTDNTQTGCIGDLELTYLNADGTTTVVQTNPLTQTGVAACTPQLNDWAVVHSAAYPNLLIEPRCNLPNGCGGLLPPNSDVTFSLMKFRYLDWTVCPTDKHYPTKVTITGHPNPKKIGVVMDLEVFQTPEKKGWTCVNKTKGTVELLDENLQPIPEADKPTCTFECSETIPEPAEPICPVESIFVFDCYENPEYDFESNPDVPEFLSNAIIAQVTTCPDEIQISYYVEVDGTIEDYNEGNGLIGFLGDENCEEVELPLCRPEGEYTGNKKCYEKKGKLVLLEKQFDETITGSQTVDVSASFGLPLGAVIATLENNLWTGGAGTIAATSTTETATIIISGTQQVCIKAMHGAAIPLVGGTDCFSSNDGVSYTFGGTLNDLADSFTDGVTGCVTQSSPSNGANVGAINWTSNGPATSVTLSTTNTNAFNSVRFFAQTYELVEAREYVSEDGKFCAWYDGKEIVDFSEYEEVECEQIASNCAPIQTGNTICGITGNEKEKTYVTMWVYQNPCTGELSYVDCATEETIDQFEKISCECDVDVSTIQVCENDAEGNCLRSFDRYIVEISNCADEGREQTDYETGTTVILTPPVGGESSVESCIDCDNALTQVCYLCEPKPAISTVKPVKAQAVKAQIRLVELKSVSKKRVLTKRENKEFQALRFAVAESKECVYGKTAEVFFTENGSSYTVNGESNTVFDSTGYTRIPCDVEICEPDQNVKIVNDVDVNLDPGLIDTCIISCGEPWILEWGLGEITLDEGGFTFTTSDGTFNIPGGTLFDLGTAHEYLNNNHPSNTWQLIQIPNSEDVGLAVCSDTQPIFMVGDDDPVLFETPDNDGDIDCICDEKQVIRGSIEKLGDQAYDQFEELLSDPECTTSTVQGCVDGKSVLLLVESCPQDTAGMNCGAIESTILFSADEFEGTVGITSMVDNWEQLQFGAGKTTATGQTQATSDVANSTGPGASSGIIGVSSCGDTHVQSLIGGQGGSQFGEGLQRQVTGLTIGTQYCLDFSQAVSNQVNGCFDRGGWTLCLDNDTANGINSAETIDPAQETNTTNVNLNWESRTICFTATATSHLVQFIPYTTDTDYTCNSWLGRMAIDCIEMRSVEEGVGNSDDCACVKINCITDPATNVNYTIDQVELLPCGTNEECITTDISSELICVEVDGTPVNVFAVTEFIRDCQTDQNLAQNLYYQSLDGEIFSVDQIQLSDACDLVIEGQVCSNGQTYNSITIGGETTYYDLGGSEVELKEFESGPCPSNDPTLVDCGTCCTYRLSRVGLYSDISSGSISGATWALFIEDLENRGWTIEESAVWNGMSLISDLTDYKFCGPSSFDSFSATSLGEPRVVSANDCEVQIALLTQGKNTESDVNGRVEALESRINRECVQIWAEDSGNTAPTTYDYSFGNGQETAVASYGNWGVALPFSGEIVAYTITRNNSSAVIQDVAITLDGAQVFNASIPANQDEIVLNGLSIPVTQGQVINWQTVTGVSPDVVPSVVVCYEIE